MYRYPEHGGSTKGLATAEQGHNAEMKISVQLLYGTATSDNVYQHAWHEQSQMRLGTGISCGACRERGF